jgi:mono/diheme cytochrome c family protein
VKKLLKVLAISVGTLVALVAVALGAVYLVSQRRIDARVAGVGHPLTVPTDSANIARGAHIVRSFGMCVECHAPDLGGATMIDVLPVARLSGFNLTGGAGGVGGTLSDADWERAIRHGVAPDGRKLLFMPSHEFAELNDDDIGAVVAYIKQVPKVNRMVPPQRVGPIARVLYLRGQMDLLPGELVDHGAAHPAVVAPGATPEYGNYLSTSCKGCHGKTFSGGPIPGAPPSLGVPANITPTGIGRYSASEFATVLRTGRRPDGSMVDTTVMPVRNTRNLDDTELAALYAFLKTVPPKPFGGR